MPTTTIPSLIPKRHGEGNNNKIDIQKLINYNTTLRLPALTVKLKY